MHEYIARTLYHLQIHLLYASFVCLVAWALTSMRFVSATTKYWIWVLTTLNFIFPAGALLDKLWSSYLYWASPLGVFGDVAGDISRGTTAVVLGIVWLLGGILMLARLCLRLGAERRKAQAIAHQTSSDRRPGFLAHGIAVIFAASRRGPAVDGVLRPHISLPDGIDHFLSQRELDAVLIHEVAHARRRDNLIRLIHELTLCGLWFHPLVWLAGRRLALYRELSCDESVIQSNHGVDLVSALAKLADPEQAFLLQATASSFISHRLARLTAQPRRPSLASNTFTAALFGAAVVAGVFATVAHTACCFTTGNSRYAAERSAVSTHGHSAPLTSARFYPPSAGVKSEIIVCVTNVCVHVHSDTYNA
jgi:beta-lactamase regulating signal transducer with metallopeptidase domain